MNYEEYFPELTPDQVYERDRYHFVPGDHEFSMEVRCERCKTWDHPCSDCRILEQDLWEETR